MYRSFARIYARGPWPEYSRRMADLLPAILDRFNLRPERVLDIACGEGTFAVAMAKKGYDVTAADASAEMLEAARSLSDKENVQIEFVRQDMRELIFRKPFDLITCWYDSLNYVLAPDDLKKVFVGVAKALAPGGVFIGDMNTIYGLEAGFPPVAGNNPNFAFVQVDTPELFSTIRQNYNPETHIAAWRITGFVKDNGNWQRVDETHLERGYSLEEVRACFTGARLAELACFGDLRNMSGPVKESKRIWWVLAGPDS